MLQDRGSRASARPEPNTESAAKWAGKNDLPFGRNFGLNGKTVLPHLLILLNQLRIWPVNRNGGGMMIGTD